MPFYIFDVFIRLYNLWAGLVVSWSHQEWIITICHILLLSSWGCNLAGSTLSGMEFVSLIEIAALGSGPLSKSYKWHVSPVNWRATTTWLGWPLLSSVLVLMSQSVKQFVLLCQQNQERGRLWLKLEPNTHCKRIFWPLKICFLLVNDNLIRFFSSSARLKTWLLTPSRIPAKLDEAFDTVGTCLVEWESCPLNLRRHQKPVRISQSKHTNSRPENLQETVVAHPQFI